ncbi:coq5 family [Colletotrichum truncatum]|uniref:Coq5 family n=1 Tax=Colletotrichum truncatum TaxID=5467 RepID=A0ACC3YH91_COLTU|nr:coq5 family [Colletotrichum truncatum]KAF6792781.1 coq5 family [Colletotrichum truncatum]
MQSFEISQSNMHLQSKLFLKPKGSDNVLKPAGDRANYTTLWRRPDAGTIYRNTEHVTAPTTQPLLDYCGLTEERIASLDQPIEVLDMCCGAGVVAAHIHAMLKRLGLEKKGLVKVTCADSSEAQISHVRERIKVEDWNDTTTVQADIARLPFESNTFDYVVVGLAIHVVAEPYVGLSELNRVLKPGGRISCSTWAVEGWVAITREAVAELSLPGQQPVPWPQKSLHLTRLWSPGAWDDEYFTYAMLNCAGFEKIDTKIITKYIPFQSAEHFCTVLGAYEIAIVERYWNQEQKCKLLPKLRPTLIEYLTNKYNKKQFEMERSVVISCGTKPSA